MFPVNAGGVTATDALLHRVRARREDASVQSVRNFVKILYRKPGAGWRMPGPGEVRHAFGVLAALFSLDDDRSQAGSVRAPRLLRHDAKGGCRLPGQRIHPDSYPLGCTAVIIHPLPLCLHARKSKSPTKSIKPNTCNTFNKL